MQNVTGNAVHPYCMVHLRGSKLFHRKVAFNNFVNFTEKNPVPPVIFTPVYQYGHPNSGAQN